MVRAGLHRLLESDPAYRHLDRDTLEAMTALFNYCAYDAILTQISGMIILSRTNFIPWHPGKRISWNNENESFEGMELYFQEEKVDAPVKLHGLLEQYLAG